MPIGRLFLIHIYILIKNGALLGSRLCGFSQFQLPTSKGQLALSPDPQCKPRDYLEDTLPEQTQSQIGLYCSQFSSSPWHLHCIKKYIYIGFILFRFLNTFFIDVFRLTVLPCPMNRKSIVLQPKI